MLNKLIYFGLSIFLLVSGAAAQQTETDADVIKIETTLVSVPVVVSDRDGRYVPNLQARDFTVLQDGKPQKIEFFAAEEEPLNIAVLLDTSRSTEPVIDEIKNAAADFVRLLKPQDRAMIVSFDSEVNFLSSLTADRRELERAIDNVEIGYDVGTVMRDAIDETVNRKFADVKGRKAIILLTDGKDHGSDVEDDELLRLLEESDVLLYSVFYETGGFGGRFGGMNGGNRGGIFGGRGGRGGGVFGGRGGMGRGGNFPRGGGSNRRVERQRENNENAKDYLEQMSDLTAGRFFQEKKSDLREIFQNVADELRRQYRLGFYPETDGKPDAAIHDIKVKVARQNVVVRARNTYRSAR